MYEYAASVLRVVDGDTISVSLDLGFHMHFVSMVRMAGYDAPERRTTEGIAAKQYLLSLLEPAGSEIVIRTTINKEFEKYGRVLGHVRRGSLDVNAEMVKAGHVKIKKEDMR